ncbi:TPA: LexA family transcriptional repressor, partial [Klebsiella pneumoniae]|nr:LexA family transcriptional repressor [Klebsiella pneumoniae]
MLNTNQERFSNLHIYHSAKNDKNEQMENKEIRKANLENLIEQQRVDAGLNKAQFAELIDTSPAALSQLIGDKP